MFSTCVNVESEDVGGPSSGSYVSIGPIDLRQEVARIFSSS
jgi:hypothetical protein